MENIAVLIPCYNESKTVEKVVRDFRQALPEATIYVYDNNSTDHTDELARKAGAVVRYEYQQGKGNVVRRMFQDIDAKCYILVDGDDTYPAEAAPKMAESVLKKNVEHTQLLFKSSGSSYLEVITAQQSLLNAQLSKITDDFHKMQAVVNLYQALGGGAK